jgi:hypothetical protein
MQQTCMSFVGRSNKAAVREFLNVMANSLGMDDDQVVIVSHAVIIVNEFLIRDKPLEKGELDRNVHADVAVAFVPCQLIKANGCVDHLTAEKLWLERSGIILDATGLNGVPDGDLEGEFELRPVDATKCAPLASLGISECTDSVFRVTCTAEQEAPTEPEISLESVSLPTWMIGAGLAGLLCIIGIFLAVHNRKALGKVVTRHMKGRWCECSFGISFSCRCAAL